MILSRQDLSDEENLRRCRHEFVKAYDTLGSAHPLKLAEWALDWGEAALHALENPEVDESALTEAERERDANADALGHLENAINTTIADFDIALEGCEGETFDKILKIISKLENAL